jgi:uncharacterized membrane-anchored protein
VSTLRKGVAVALVQMLLVLLVGAKLYVDRWRYPQVWVETAPYDPELPLRGRYVRLLAVVGVDTTAADTTSGGMWLYRQRGRLEVRGDRLVAVPDEQGRVLFSRGTCRGEECVTLTEPLAFFIPEDVPDPSIRGRGEDLWVKVTVPPRGAPRPIELGVRSGGDIEPLRLRR